MLSVLNHIVSILYEQGLQTGLSIPCTFLIFTSSYNAFRKFGKNAITTKSLWITTLFAGRTFRNRVQIFLQARKKK